MITACLQTPLHKCNTSDHLLSLKVLQAADALQVNQAAAADATGNLFKYYDVMWPSLVLRYLNAKDDLIGYAMKVLHYTCWSVGLVEVRGSCRESTPPS